MLAISFTVHVLPVRKKVSEKIHGFPNIQLMLSLKFQSISYSGRVLLTLLTTVSVLIFAVKLRRFPKADSDVSMNLIVLNDRISRLVK